MRERLPEFDIVLLGVGHTNAHVLNMWRMHALLGARLTCVSNFPLATYSGMLPGTLAGQYQPAGLQIDLVRLCAAAGARLVTATVIGLDVQQRQLLFKERPPLPFDALSIGVGSRPAEVPGSGSRVLETKPMQTFLPRLEDSLTKLEQQVNDRPWRFVVVGAGAGGFELACCLPRYIRQRHPSACFELTLIDHSDEILKGMPARTRKLALQQLARQDIQLSLGQAIDTISEQGEIKFGGGRELPADLILWATSARAPKILEQFDLPKDDQGFLLTRHTLQSVAADSIFVVGDTGTLQQQPLAKSGVYAVRQGPILWENLKRQVAGQPLRNWQPQKSFLSLLNTGDDRAIFTYKGLSAHSRWCWKLKDFIDRRFMAMYQDYRPTMASPATHPLSNQEMQCGGCGSKLPATVLSRVLSRLDNPPSSRVVLGLEQPDDVAVIQQQPAYQTAITTDFFTSFLNDPHLLGQVAAENALSDLYAAGAVPQAALAAVTVPRGPAHKQEQFLLEVLDGALHAFRPAGVPIVGGHTIQGDQATVGFTVLGDIEPQQFTGKTALQPGDQLVLTKPLGTGILLAGHQRALCCADWMTELRASMLSSNRCASEVARQFDIRAVTDITGFGLAGHLWEMLRGSSLAAELSLQAIPLLPGVSELLALSIESTLAPSNRHVEAHVHAAAETRNQQPYAALFDPQTSGGLLLGVPLSSVDKVLAQLPKPAAVIGQITKLSAKETPVIHVHLSGGGSIS